MPAPRPSNPQLVSDIKFLLTEGFASEMETLPVETRSMVIDLTKPWRNKMWQQLRLIDLRLNPTTSDGGPRP